MASGTRTTTTGNEQYLAMLRARREEEARQRALEEAQRKAAEQAAEQQAQQLATQQQQPVADTGAPQVFGASGFRNTAAPSDAPVLTAPVVGDKDLDDNLLSPPAPTSEPLDQLEQLLEGAPMEAPSMPDETVVTQDPRNVNDARHPLEVDRAWQVVGNVLPAEQEAFNTLDPEQQRQYLEVRNAVMEDPYSVASLQRLLLQEGTLQNVDPVDGVSTIERLDVLANSNTPLAEGIDRVPMLQDLVKELATPSAISQGPVGSCVPTAMLIELAQSQPAEYVRLTAGLASPEGTVTLQDGQMQLQREEGTAAADHTGRTTTQRLLGSAFMEASNGDRDYVNATGEGGGATFSDFAPVAEAALGYPLEVGEVYQTSPELQLDIIRESLALGKPIEISMQWAPEGQEHAYHAVLVTGVTEENGEEQFTFTNPWGREEQMPASELTERITGTVYQPEADDAPKARRDEAMARIEAALHNVDDADVVIERDGELQFITITGEQTVEMAKADPATGEVHRYTERHITFTNADGVTESMSVEDLWQHLESTDYNPDKGPVEAVIDGAERAWKDLVSAARAASGGVSYRAG